MFVYRHRFKKNNNVFVTFSLLGGDYMIPFCQDEISTRPAGKDFTLRLHGEIHFHRGKAGPVFTRRDLVFVYKNP